MDKNAQVEIGNDCGFSGTVIAAAKKISIGDGVMCGANVTITDTDWHPLHKNDRILGKPAKSDAVTIGSNVWLGLNVIVLKGVTIGNGTVVSANSVVAKDLPEDVLAGGTPAKVIKSLINA